MPGPDEEGARHSVVRPPGPFPMTGNGSQATSPLVSVVIPFLDPPISFFQEAVEGVFSQTFQNWELILVDDGSGPEATSFARRLAADHARRVRYLAHEGRANRGIAASRNLGLANARGQLLACLDSDDWWTPNKLLEQVAILQDAPHIHAVFGRSLYWTSWKAGASIKTDRLHPLRVPDRTEMRKGEFLLRILTSDIAVPCPSSVLVRTDHAIAVRGFDHEVSNHYEDQAFYAKLSLEGVILACEDVWDRYRIHADSVLARGSRAQARAARRDFLEWLEREVQSREEIRPELMRAIKLERAAARIPKGPGMLRLIRRLFR